MTAPSDLVVWPLLLEAIAHGFSFDSEHRLWRCKPGGALFDMADWSQVFGLASWTEEFPQGRPFIPSYTWRSFFNNGWLGEVNVSVPPEQRCSVMGRQAQAHAVDAGLPTLRYNLRSPGILWLAEIVRRTHWLRYQAWCHDAATFALPDKLVALISCFGVRFQEWTTAEKWVRHRAAGFLLGPGVREIELMVPDKSEDVIRMAILCQKGLAAHKQPGQAWTTLSIQKLQEYRMIMVKCSCGIRLEVVTDPTVLQRAQAYAKYYEHQSTGKFIWKPRA